MRGVAASSEASIVRVHTGDNDGVRVVCWVCDSVHKRRVACFSRAPLSLSHAGQLPLLPECRWPPLAPAWAAWSRAEEFSHGRHLHVVRRT